MKTQRPRHPKPELEALIKEAERFGWRVTRERKYYKALCPCSMKCMETIHISPSDPNYGRNKRNKMSRCEAWEESV
jgi:hypothetical protein